MPPHLLVEQAAQSLSAIGRTPFHPFKRSVAWSMAWIGKVIFAPSTKMAARLHTYFDVCIVTGILVTQIVTE
jgi:hypothetical protein